MIPEDCWVQILSYLSIDDYLNIRLISKRHSVLFDYCLPFLTDIYDIPSCTSVKELIHNYASADRFWKLLPSFTKIQREHYCIFHQCLGTKQTDHRFRKFLHAVWLRRPDLRDEPEYQFKLDLTKRKLLRYETLQIKDWSNLKSDYLDFCSYVILSGRHSLLTRFIQHVRTRSLEDQKDFLFGIIIYGASSYYLEVLNDIIIKVKKLYSRSYFEAICRSQHQYLLKKKLTEEGHAFVGKEWNWPEGSRLCKLRNKYKK